MRRGLLQIRSERSPYRRACLAWPSREPVETDIRDLTAADLLELARDPVLTILIGEEGGFRPMPAIPDDIGVEQVQLMIDTLASELPPVASADAPSSPEQAEIARLEQLHDELREAHVAFVAELLARDIGHIDMDATQAVRSVLEHVDALAFDLANARDLGAQLSGKLEKATIDLSDRDKVIADQVAEIAQLKAVATAGEPKPAKAGRGKPPSQGSGES